MVPKKSPKWSPKGTPKVSQNHKNGFPKPSQERVPKKQRNNCDFQHPHTPLDRALAAARARFSLFDKMCLWPFWVSFWRCFGRPNGGQGHQKAISKNVKNLMPNMSPNWSQRGSQNGAKIVKNEVLEASCFKGGSQEASRPPPGSILNRFWDHFGTIFVSFSNIFLMIFACIL